jgi:DNA-3-methyladenine glycosylase
MIPPNPKKPKPIPLKTYQSDDVLRLSQALLGKCLISTIGGVLTGGMITETEAYRGPEDRGSHAYNNRRTKRNEVMFHRGGISYVYRCYGIHSLFNVVTNQPEIPHAILIRAIKPLWGLEAMYSRRKTDNLKKLTAGPGTLTQALEIDTLHNGLPLTGPLIWIEDRGVQFSEAEIVASPRVGIDYAGEDALLPWRFRIMETVRVE